MTTAEGRSAQEAANRARIARDAATVAKSAIGIGTFIASIALSFLGVPSTANKVSQDSYNAIPNQLLPAQGLIILRRREIIDQDAYRREMRLQGFDTNRADALLLAEEFFPTPQDLVNWQAKEVFEPDAVERFGLDAEFEKLDLDSFFKAGVSEEQALNFWRAHWQHPSFLQAIEMLHRDVITGAEKRDQVEAGTSAWSVLREEGNEALSEWFRLVEIPPHWREPMRRIGESLFTRVDVRRMWDMRMLSESELLRANLDLGLPLERAQQMVTWTKVFTDFPDLMARYSNGWISSKDVLRRLENFGMPPERAQELLETRMDNLARPERGVIERDLTKAEIVKGVKKDVITRTQGQVLLMDMGYDPEEAVFVMNINIEAGESPETPLEFKALTQAYRRSVGLDAVDVPVGALAAERRLRDAKNALSEGVDGMMPDDKLLGLRTAVANAESVLASEMSVIELATAAGEKASEFST